MKLSSPDYKGMDEKQARDDFKKRLENYERAYQTLGEEDEEDGIQYCKLINVGKKVMIQACRERHPQHCLHLYF
jgi:6-phosphofructo-2-kinase